MIPSPKVATYDKQPAMSVQGVADKVVEVLAKEEQDFVMCNFAPPDMVLLLSVTSIYILLTLVFTSRSVILVFMKQRLKR